MWTIAGGIILGVVGLRLLAALFGGPSRRELEIRAIRNVTDRVKD